MTEYQILRCMLDVADMLYHNTGDKWWLEIGIEISRRLNRSKNALGKKTKK